MARNASGTYSKPTGQPVVTNTAISSVAHNDLVTDLATEITDSLSRSGKGGMLAALKAYAGTVSLPGLAFDAETSSGLYRVGAGDVRLAILGALVVKFTAAGVDVTGALTSTTATTTATAGTDWSFSSNNVSKVAGVVTFNALGTATVGSATWSSIATLPVGYRPLNSMIVIGIIQKSGTEYAARVAVTSGGVVLVGYYDDGTSMANISGLPINTGSSLNVSCTFVAA